MSSDELTKELPNDEPGKNQPVGMVPPTQPMLEAIMEQMKDGFARMDEGFNIVNSRLDVLERDVKEIKRNQRVHNDQMLSMQGRQREAEDRLDDLERKAS